MVDAYLYLGPSDLLLVEPGPAEIFLNKDYMKELKRRAALMGGGPWADQENPDSVSDRDSNPFLLEAFKTLFHSLGIVVGPSPSASSPTVDIPWRIPQRLETIHLSPEALKKFAGEYVPDSPAGVSIPLLRSRPTRKGCGSILEWEVSAGSCRCLPRNSCRTILRRPGLHSCRMKKERSRGLIFRGIATTKATRLP